MFPATVHPSPPPWPQGLSPRRAPVKPRARSAPDADPLPLEDHIASLLQTNTRGVVNLFGPAGSGKTTALNHLAAHFGPRADLRFADNRYPDWVNPAAETSLILFTSRQPRHESIHAFELTPWTRDEFIEYLLATHRDRCPSVMQRILARGDDHDDLPGLPELWQPLLDLLAADPSIQTCGNALRKLLWSRVPDPGARLILASFCLGLLSETETDADVDRLVNDTPDALRLTRYRPVQVCFAAEGIVHELQSHRPCPSIRQPLPRDLFREIAIVLSTRAAARQRLESFISSRDRELHPAAAGLLLAADPLWRPAEDAIPNLAGARLQNASWSSIHLWGADLKSADLTSASLDEAELPDADLLHATLAGAKLQRAWLERAHLQEARLAGADLTAARADFADFSAARLAGACLLNASLKHAIFQGADLTRARLCGADLSHARLQDATITDADFSGCCLDHASLARLSLRLACFRGASFRSANLVNADLQGIHLPCADFRAARLAGADLTAASLAGADFTSANLRSAGLADIDLENADLSDADLRGATFHLGSTRSGLVPGDTPSEGTRTGFYTDDYDEHHHQPPEQIRRANLRGADLIGARIDDTDFYLVDLRDAEYTPDQRTHFRRCRAIL